MNNNNNIRSVEVLSITPSFMDIPTRQSNDNLNHNLSSDSLSSKQRSFSIDRNHRYFTPSSFMNKASSPTTINPSIVSNIDDQISLNSIQSFPTSGINDVLEVSSNNNDYSIGNQNQTYQNQSQNNQDQFNTNLMMNTNDVDNIAMPQMSQFVTTPSNEGIMNDEIVDQQLLPQQQQPQQPQQQQQQQSQRINRRKANSNGTNFNPSLTLQGPHNNEVPNSSPLSSIQTTSPPSQLLTDQGFADLDNFMSSL